MRFSFPQLNINKRTWLAILAVVVLALAASFYFFIKQSPQAEAGWWDEGWYYRKALVIDYTKVDSELTNFPVAVQFNTTNNIYANTNSDGSDLRFTDINGNLLNYEIEKWNESGTSTVWVKLPTVYANASTTFYIYYGNPTATDAQTPTEVWDDNFVGVWHMNNTATGTDSFVDSTKYNNHGTGAGSGTSLVATSSGIIDGAFEVDGIDDRVEVPNDSSLSGMSQLTMSGWVYFDQLPSVIGHEGLLMVKRHEGEPYDSYYLDVVGSSGCASPNVMLATIKNQVEGTDYKCANTSLTANQWYYIASTWDGSNIHFYLNGVNDDYDDTTFSGTSVFVSDGILYINSDDSTGGRIDGKIDDVRISKIARSAAWLRADYYNGLNTLVTQGTEEQGPGPIAYWSLDEGYGTTANDYSTGGNNGTITGATWKDSTECVKGKCLYFDGSGDYITSINNIGITGNSPRTVSIWFKQNISAEKNIFGFGGNASTELFDILLDNGSTLIGHFYGGGNDTITGAPSYKFNEWNHAVLTYDGSKVDVYLNGIYRNSKTIDLNTSSSQVIIGGGKYAAYNYFQGYIDEVKVYNYARTADQIRQDYNKGLSVSLGGGQYSSLSDGLVGWWQFDEPSNATTFLDSSGNGNTLTSFSNASTTAGKYGNAGVFDGVDDYTYLSNEEDFRIWGPISIALWVKPDNITTEWTRFVDKYYATGYTFSTGDGAGLDDLSFWHNNNAVIDTGPVLTLNQWQHVAVTYDGQMVKIFLNGELIDSAPYSGVASGNTNSLYVGGTSTYTRDLDGQLDDVRVYNRGLSDDEVRRLYEWAPGPVGYWKFDEGNGQNIFSSVAATGTVGQGYLGSSISVESNDPTWEIGKYGSALKFDAINAEHVYVPDPGTNSVYDFTTNDSISFALWLKPLVYGAYDGFICKGSANNENWGIEWEGSGSYNRPQFYFRRDDETGWSLYRANQTIPLNEWSHIAVSYTFGSSTSIKMYVDGVLTTGSWINGTGAEIPDNDNTGIYIGKSQWNGEEFTGFIDDVRLYRYIRSPRQILEDMNAGRQNNPIGYWSFDEGDGQTAKDFSGYNYDLTLGASTATSTDDPTRTKSGKFNSALQFDGSNDYIQASSEITVYNFGTNDFSTSFYVKYNDAKNYGALVGQGYLASVTGWGFFYDSSGKISFQTRNGANISQIASDKPLNDGKWHHIFGIRENGTMKMFIDGVLQVDINSTVRDISGGGGIFAIGARNSSGLNYYSQAAIDEVKVYNYALTLDEIRQNLNVGQQVTLSRSANDNLTDSLLAYWPMDGDLTDASGNGNTGTASGATATSSAKFGKAYAIGGGSNYISVNTSASLDSYTDKLTVSGWYYFNTLTPSQQWLFDKANNYYLRVTDTGAFTNYLFGINNEDYWNTGSGLVTTGRWYYIVFTYDGQERKLYIDGQLKASRADTGTISNGGDLTIGNRASHIEPMDGQVDDIKIYNKALSADEIAQIYADGHLPIGYWKLDDLSGTTAVDASGNGNTGTLTNGPVWKERGKVGGAIFFDGSDDHVLLEKHTAVQNFSLSLWFNIVSSPGGSSAVLAGGYTGYGGSLLKVDSATNIRLRTEGDYTSDFTVPTMQQNTWYHLVVTRENSSTRVYINGQESTSGSKTNIGDFVLKKISGYQAGQYFNGTIDEVKLFDYALTPRQVRQVYNGGGPIAYWKMDEGEGTSVKDYSGSGNHGTLVVGSGGTQSDINSAWTNGLSGKINGSLNFDGTDDFVQVSTPSYTNYTLSTWFKYQTNTNTGGLLFGQRTAGCYGSAIYFNGTTNANLRWYASGPEANILNKVEANRWYHLTIVRNASGTDFYIDGLWQASSTSALVSSSLLSTIGSSCNGEQASNIKVDEVRLYNYELTPEEIKQEYNGGFSGYFR